jgi:hypothetical protein
VPPVVLQNYRFDPPPSNYIGKSHYPIIMRDANTWNGKAQIKHLSLHGSARTHHKRIKTKSERTNLTQLCKPGVIQRCIGQRGVVHDHPVALIFCSNIRHGLNLIW